MDKQKLVKIFGMGQITNEGGKLKYIGTMPFKEGELVVILKHSHLNNILQAEMNLLMHYAHDMPQQMYVGEANTRRCKTCMTLPDEMVVGWKGNAFKMFLDRRFYSNKPDRYIFVRWENVNQALTEEPI
jgi:hypothetical protein